MLRIEIVYPFLLSCFREKQKEKEYKKKEVEDGGVLRGALALPLLLLEHLVPNTLTMSFSHGEYNRNHHCHHHQRHPQIRRIAISKVCPGAADSPVCDPAVVYPLIPQQAQDAGQQRQST